MRKFNKLVLCSYILSALLFKRLNLHLGIGNIAQQNGEMLEERHRGQLNDFQHGRRSTCFITDEASVVSETFDKSRSRVSSIYISSYPIKVYERKCVHTQQQHGRGVTQDVCSYKMRWTDGQFARKRENYYIADFITYIILK